MYSFIHNAIPGGGLEHLISDQHPHGARMGQFGLDLSKQPGESDEDYKRRLDSYQATAERLKQLYNQGISDQLKKEAEDKSDPLAEAKAVTASYIDSGKIAEANASLAQIRGKERELQLASSNLPRAEAGAAYQAKADELIQKIRQNPERTPFGEILNRGYLLEANVIRHWGDAAWLKRLAADFRADAASGRENGAYDFIFRGGPGGLVDLITGKISAAFLASHRAWQGDEAASAQAWDELMRAIRQRAASNNDKKLVLAALIEEGADLKQIVKILEGDQEAFWQAAYALANTITPLAGAPPTVNIPFAPPSVPAVPAGATVSTANPFFKYEPAPGWRTRFRLYSGAESGVSPAGGGYAYTWRPAGTAARGAVRIVAIPPTAAQLTVEPAIPTPRWYWDGSKWISEAEHLNYTVAFVKGPSGELVPVGGGASFPSVTSPTRPTGPPRVTPPVPIDIVQLRAQIAETMKSGGAVPSLPSYTERALRTFREAQRRYAAGGGVVPAGAPPVAFRTFTSVEQMIGYDLRRGTLRPDGWFIPERGLNLKPVNLATVPAEIKTVPLPESLSTVSIEGLRRFMAAARAVNDTASIARLTAEYVRRTGLPGPLPVGVLGETCEQAIARLQQEISLKRGSGIPGSEREAYNAEMELNALLRQCAPQAMQATPQFMVSPVITVPSFRTVQQARTAPAPSSATPLTVRASGGVSVRPSASTAPTSEVRMAQADVNEAAQEVQDMMTAAGGERGAVDAARSGIADGMLAELRDQEASLARLVADHRASGVPIDGRDLFDRVRRLEELRTNLARIGVQTPPKLIPYELSATAAPSAYYPFSSMTIMVSPAATPPAPSPATSPAASVPNPLTAIATSATAPSNSPAP